MLKSKCGFGQNQQQYLVRIWSSESRWSEPVSMSMVVTLATSAKVEQLMFSRMKFSSSASALDNTWNCTSQVSMAFEAFKSLRPSVIGLLYQRYGKSLQHVFSMNSTPPTTGGTCYRSDRNGLSTSSHCPVLTIGFLLIAWMIEKHAVTCKCTISMHCIDANESLRLNICGIPPILYTHHVMDFPVLQQAGMWR